MAGHQHKTSRICAWLGPEHATQPLRNNMNAFWWQSVGLATCSWIIYATQRRMTVTQSQLMKYVHREPNSAWPMEDEFRQLAAAAT
eukprot:9787993-Karenia_brevis.AAC.1